MMSDGFFKRCAVGGRVTRCAAAGVFCALVLLGCQPEAGHLPGADFNPAVTTRDPAILKSLLLSVNTPEASRKNADRLLVETGGKADPARLGALEQILYAPGNSEEMRIYAIDALADADAARAGRELGLYLLQLDGQARAHACEVAARLGDPRLIDPLIRSLATADGDVHARAEWPAIRTLGGGDPVETLYRRLEQSDDRPARTAALDLLARLDAARVKTRLAAMTRIDSWLADLQWWGATFDALPTGENEMRWVQILHRPEHAALVSRALERHNLLKSAADYSLAPRFIHTLAYMDAATVALPRGTLVATLKTRLDGLRHLRREADFPGSPEDIDSALSAQENKLSRADLFNIHLLLNTLADPAAVAELYRQGLADMSDTHTEHGGLLAFQNVNAPTLLITPYPSMYADNDLEYITSDKLLDDTPTGVAQYHFHFQQVHNEARAGPGPGDLAYIRRTRANCVVITSTNTREMNIDYYTPTGAVVDLGIYRAN